MITYFRIILLSFIVACFCLGIIVGGLIGCAGEPVKVRNPDTPIANTGRSITYTCGPVGLHCTYSAGQWNCKCQ